MTAPTFRLVIMFMLGALVFAVGTGAAKLIDTIDEQPDPVVFVVDPQMVDPLALAEFLLERASTTTTATTVP
jgi:hypothetical protein